LIIPSIPSSPLFPIALPASFIEPPYPTRTNRSTTSRSKNLDELLLTRFTPRKILRIAKYKGFEPYEIEFERSHAIKHYMQYVPELVDHKRLERGAKWSNLFALTKEGEQYCKAIIDDLDRAALPKKNFKENESVLERSELNE
jgi:hypothetical protein